MEWSKQITHVYNTLVKTKIEYANTACASANEQYLVNIDNIQKLAFRLGIIDEFETVKDIIRRTDKELLSKSQKFHILYDMVNESSRHSHADKKKYATDVYYLSKNIKQP